MYRILVVDDEAIEREGIVFLIEEKNYLFEIYTATNGEEAYEIVNSLDNKQTAVDLIITDIKMPFMDGLEFSALVKGKYPSMMIIIFSAYGDFEYAKKAIQIKIDDYLLKPIVVEEFYRLIDKCIKLLDEREENNKKKQILAEQYQKISHAQQQMLFESVLYEKGDIYGIEEELAKEKTVIDTAIRLIEEHYMEDISLEYIAEKIYLSPGYLSGLFKRKIGKNITQYITLYRMEKAKKLLITTNMKVIDICRSIGYNSPSYFGLQFKKIYNMSPNRMREWDGEKNE